MEDYYAILGVAPEATKEAIDKAYREKALLYHPDRNLDNTEAAAAKFKEVSKAYEVLGDESKRRDYDLSRSGARFGGHPFDGSAASYEDLSRDPFFNRFMNRARRWQSRQARQARRTRDVFMDLDLSFLEAAKGCKKNIVVQRMVHCKDCGGTGVASWQDCPSCQGTGRIEIQAAPLTVRVGCPDCRGGGQIPKQVCTCKDGFSEVREEAAVIDVPAGIDTGMSVRFQGKGEDGSDLVVKVRVLPHEFFQRDGMTLICEFPVSYSQLVLGDIIEVPGIESRLSVKIPPGTVPGSRVRLRQQGIEDVRKPGSRGDYYVVLKLEMPKGNEDYQNAVRGLQDIEKQHLAGLLKRFEQAG